MVGCEGVAHRVFWAPIRRVTRLFAVGADDVVTQIRVMRFVADEAGPARTLTAEVTWLIAVIAHPAPRVASGGPSIPSDRV